MGLITANSKFNCRKKADNSAEMYIFDKVTKKPENDQIKVR